MCHSLSHRGRTRNRRHRKRSPTHTRSTSASSGKSSIRGSIKFNSGGYQATTSSMRVFREGRIVSPLQADSSLLSGDVLIVESKQRRAAVNGAFNPEPQAYRVQPTAATSSDSDGVHVAFLNLLETPVVVKLRPENAQIEQIVQMLGQPIELSPSVTVLNSERVSRVDSDPSLSHSRVSDGSILIFPQRGVDRTRFPPFPQPFALEIETDAIAEANADPRKQSIELPKVRQMAHPNEIISSAYSAQPGMTIAVAVSQPMTLVAPPPPLASRYESSSPANDFASRMATRPFCGSPQFHLLLGTIPTCGGSEDPSSNTPTSLRCQTTRISLNQPTGTLNHHSPRFNCWDSLA